MTDQPTPRGKSFFAAAPAPETDAMLASDPPSDWPTFARALEIQRNAARADVARLRDALEKMLIAEMEVWQMGGLSADEVETEPHWMAARAALATPAK